MHITRCWLAAVRQGTGGVISPAPSGSTRPLKEMLLPASAGPPSLSSQAHEPLGIRIRSVRPSSSFPASAGRSAKAAPIEEIRPGDVVWFSPGEKHWHGATSTTAMTHVAIAEALDGKVVEWMEQVSDEQIPELDRKKKESIGIPMQKRKLGKNNLEVSALRLWLHGTELRLRKSQTKNLILIALIRAAVEHGVTLFDTAEACGPFTNEELVGEALAPAA